MNKQPVFILIFSLVFSLPEVSPAQTNQRDPCKHPKVHYEPFDEGSYGYNKIMLSEISSNDDFAVLIDSLEQVHTSSGTRWFVVDDPNFMKPGPWNTQTYIGDKAGPKWSMKFENHSSYGVKVNWINEQLLYFSVWWGQIVSTDLILDTETGKYVYQRQANYRELTISCPDSSTERN